MKMELTTMGRDRRKKILLLSPFFYPEMISTGKYNTYLVQALVKKGHNVEIVTSHPLYPTWKPQKCKEVMNDIKIHRGGSTVRYPKNSILRRIFLEAWFTCHVIRSVSSIKDIDVILSIFPPVVFFPFTIPFLGQNSIRIGIVHDLQAVVYGFNGFLKKNLADMIQKIEKKTFSKCDRLIFLSKTMAEDAISAYKLQRSKCHVHYPFTTLKSNERLNGNLSYLFPNGFRHVVYSGALGEKQNPYGLIQFFQQLTSKSSDVCCHIFSRGPIFDKLSLLNNGNYDRISFHDLVAEKDLPSLYAHSTVQIVPQKLGSSGGAFPSKLPNILAAGTPTFAICDQNSELSTILNESGIGTTASTWNVNTLVEKLNVFLSSLQKKKNDTVLQNFIDSKFNIDNLLSTIVS